MGPAVSLFDGFQDALIDICSISLTVLGVPSMAVSSLVAKHCEQK